MKAFLLAAGLGTRLGDLVTDTPKCLLRVGGMTMLDLWITRLLECTEQIRYNTHHHADKVTVHVLDLYGRIIVEGRLRQMLEPTLLGSARTLYESRAWIDETIVVVYCDVWTRFDIQKIIGYHLLTGSRATLAVFNTEMPLDCGIIDMRDDGTIRKMTEKPARPKGRKAWAGIAVFEPSSITDTLRENDRDIGADLLPRMIEIYGDVRAYPIDEPVIDIGTKINYERANWEALK